MNQFYHLFKKAENISEIEIKCRQVFKNFPVTTKGTASGKFSKHYQSWQFYKDSKQELIQEIVKLVESCIVEFKKVYPKKTFYYQFIQVVYNEDCRELLCIPHKDAYCYDGQFHITVLGNANISMWSGERDKPIEKQNIYVDNGSIWYINSSEFFHTIKPYKKPTRDSSFERIEILVPIAGQGNKADEEEMLKAVSQDEDRFFYPDNKNFIALKKKGIEYCLKAYNKGIASAPKPIGFIHNIEELSKYNIVKD